MALQVRWYGHLHDEAPQGVGRRDKELEDENQRLKKMYAEERLKAELRQEALEGKW